VFINLAALAGPQADRPDAMLDVNYHACVSAAEACEELGFGHFIQSSTQATAAERSGQVPYAKHKAMADYALARRLTIPVTIASLGLLYCKDDITVGQDRVGPDMNTAREKGVKLNLIDLSLLPLTPIMGSGKAPLQPMEVSDASKRIAFLATCDPSVRPRQDKKSSTIEKLHALHPGLRYYDAVGPETISILELLRRFAKYQGKNNFRPVYIDYRHMETVLNVRSLGNLNRQFVSLLRSEQDSISPPSLGDGRVWCSLLKPKSGEGEGDGERWDEESSLVTLKEAFGRVGSPGEAFRRRRYPYLKNLKFIYENPRVVWPGILLSAEIILSWLAGKVPGDEEGGFN
jgi:nucleoside-diphosphate-sugar epimerase